MKLIITVDDKLGKLKGKLSRMTYEGIPLNKRPKLVSNNYFYLSNLRNEVAIIEIDEDLVHNDTILYLHPSVKELYYPKIDLIDL
jgi:hypothetical protein